MLVSKEVRPDHNHPKKMSEEEYFLDKAKPRLEGGFDTRGNGSNYSTMWISIQKEHDRGRP